MSEYDVLLEEPPASAPAPASEYDVLLDEPAPVPTATAAEPSEYDVLLEDAPAAPTPVSPELQAIRDNLNAKPLFGDMTLKEAFHEPTLSIPKMDPEGSTARQIVAGVVNPVAQMAEGISSPEGIAVGGALALGGPVAKIVGALLGAKAAKETPNVVDAVIEAKGAYETTSAITGALLNTSMILPAAHSVSRGKGGTLPTDVKGEPRMAPEQVLKKDLESEIATVVPEEAAPKTQPTPEQPPPVPPKEAPPSAPPAPEGEPISVGPGAASVTETLASYEPRRFSERFQEDFQIEPAVREATGNRYYEPIPNKITVSDAESIVETRGIDESVRLVRDEAVNMEPRVRATLGQGLIKKLNKSYAEAQVKGDPNAGRFLDQAVDTAEYLGELGTRLGQGVQSFAIWSRLTPEGMLVSAQRAVSKGRAEYETTNAGPLKELIDAVNEAPVGQKAAVIIKISKTNPVAKKVKSDAAKIAEMAAKNELTKDAFYDAVSEKLGVPTLRRADVEKISEMAKEIEAAPEGFQRDEKTIQLLSHIAKLKGADLSEIPTAMFYANILSGYTTQFVNTVDTGINVLSESAIMAANHPKAAPQILSGLYQGLVKGSVEAAMILKKGKSPTENKLRVPPILERTEFGKEGGVPISEANAFGRFMKHALESKVAKPLNLWKYPLRAMVASDTVLFSSFKEARTRLLARVLAEKEGLTNDALFARVDELLNRGTTPEAAAQLAAGEGLTGLRAKRRANEIVEQGRPEALIESAEEGARIATYNYEPVGVLGLVSRHIGSIVNNFKLGIAVVPFTRIIANVTNRGLDYTPWGYKRLFFGQSGGRGFETKAPVGEAYKAQLVKATLGTTAMATVAALDANGTIMLSAEGPSDPKHRNQLKNAGWKPYSIKVGNTYWSYQYTPFNLAFAMVGHYRDAIRYGKLEEKDALSRVAYSMFGSAQSIFDMSFLTGVGDFLQALKGRGESSEGIGRLFSRTATSAVIPNLVKQLDRLFDPTIYKADSITQGLIRETPIARQGLAPMLNVLGERIEYSQNRFFSKAKPDPVWAFIVEKQAWVPVPSKTAKVGNRPISQREYYELIKQSGPKIRQFIEKNLPELQKKSKEEAQDAIRESAEAIRANIKGKFKASSPL